VAQWWRTSALTLWAVAGAAGLFQLMVLNVASYTYPHLPLRGWVIVALLLAASLVARRRWPLAVVPAEDQFESTVGQAMNDMFARIATGTVLTSDDVKTALASAQDTASAAIG